MLRRVRVTLLALGCVVLASCGSAADEPPESERPPTQRIGLLLAASVAHADGRPVGARFERLRLQDGVWLRDVRDDPDSQVFHHARAFDPPGPMPLSVVTLGGTAATVKLWSPSSAGFDVSEAWRAEFSPEHSRMRDVAVGRLYGSAPGPGGTVGDVLVVGTHDEGVVAVLSARADRGFEVTELDRRPSTVVHEIEIGDLDGDGVLEVYASLSSPLALTTGADQPGSVVRYVPAEGGGPEQVVDLGRRHAKEILVDDVDGDGRDELYVVVEARTEGAGDAMEIMEPVEIRRFDSAGPPEGTVIAMLEDRMTRFLVAGDLEGDGRRELVAATFSAGLYRIDPPRGDAGGDWSLRLIDRESGGFEHAALLTDLDEDGADELYVSDDPSGELRRYVTDGRGTSRTVIRRVPPRSAITWSLEPCPAELAP